jgi:hypothetical protein
MRRYAKKVGTILRGNSALWFLAPTLFFTNYEYKERYEIKDKK